MKTGTYKLVRIMNHYHIAGEECRHTRKRVQKAIRRKKRSKSIVGVTLVLWALITAICLPFMSSTVTYAAEQPQITEKAMIDLPTKSIKPETIEEKITKVSRQYGIPEKSIHTIVKCESHYNVNAKNINKRESSHGLVQINVLAHNNVNIAEAADPDFAITFLANHWKERHQMWVTCAKNT